MLKDVKKYGNSGGVYLPAEWVGGQVRVELVRKPVDLRADLAKIDLEHAISAIIYGSYARGDREGDSDIDIILVTDDHGTDIPPEIRQRYDVRTMTEKQMRDSMANDPIFHKSIKDSSIAIINHGFLKELANIELNHDPIEYRIDLAESSLALTKSILDGYEGSEELVYPLIMRLKEMIILECLFSDKKYTTKLLKKEISKAVGDADLKAVMSIYRAARDGKRNSILLPKHAVNSLVSSLEKKIENVKQKARQKGY